MLLSYSLHQRMSKALKEVDLTKISDDPYVHFGDVLQLLQPDNHAVLCCNVDEKVLYGGSWGPC